MTLPTDAKSRKQVPLASGLFDYFPDALEEVAHISYVGNEQHNPGQPLHWNRSLSTDEADAMLRHFRDRGGRDTDGLRHSAKMAWRALALLQKEIEADEGVPLPRGAKLASPKEMVKDQYAAEWDAIVEGRDFSRLHERHAGDDWHHPAVGASHYPYSNTFIRQMGEPLSQFHPDRDSGCQPSKEKSENAE